MRPTFLSDEALDHLDTDAQTEFETHGGDGLGRRRTLNQEDSILDILDSLSEGADEDEDSKMFEGFEYE